MEKNNNTPVSERANWQTKWNWSGFVQTLAFGVGNRAYLSLLILIPLFNIVWMFVAGFNAERWVRDNERNEFRDELEFRRSMAAWNRSGFIMFFVGIVSLVVYLLILMVGVSASGISSITS